MGVGGAVKAAGKAIRGTYRFGKKVLNAPSAVENMTSSLGSSINNIPKNILSNINKFLDTRETQETQNTKNSNKSSKISKETIKSNEDIVATLSAIGEEIANTSKNLEPKDSRKLDEISNSLKGISKQLYDIKNSLIDNQDTSIKKSLNAPLLNNMIEEKNEEKTEEKEGFLSSLLSGLASLFGISLLGLRNHLGSFLKSPLKFILNLLKGGMDGLWKILEPLISPITKGLTASIDWIKGKWNSLIDLVNKIPGVDASKFKLEDKKSSEKIKESKKLEESKKVSNAKNAKNTKELGFFEKGLNSITNFASSAWESTKNFTVKQIDNIKDWTNKTIDSFKNTWLGDIIEKGYNKLSSVCKAVWEQAANFIRQSKDFFLKVCDNVSDVVSKTWENAKYTAKKWVIEPAIKFMKSLASGFISPKLLNIFESIFNNLNKILPKIAKTAGNAASKALPGVGFAVGIWVAIDYFSKGRWVLGSLSALSAIISLLPGIGAVVAICLDMGILAADIITSPDDVEKLNKEQEDAIKKVNDAQEKEAKKSGSLGVKEPKEAQYAKDDKIPSSAMKGTPNYDLKANGLKSSNEYAANFMPHQVDSKGAVVSVMSGSIYKGLTWEEANKYEKSRVELDKKYNETVNALSKTDNDEEQKKLGDLLDAIEKEKSNLESYYENIKRQRLQDKNININIFRSNVNNTKSSTTINQNNITKNINSSNTINVNNSNQNMPNYDSKKDTTIEQNLSLNEQKSESSRSSGNSESAVENCVAGTCEQLNQGDPNKGTSSGGTPGAKAAAQFSKHFNVGKYTGNCAKYVRSYLMAAGYPLSGWPTSAYKYASFLPQYGFEPINQPASKVNYQVGDIAVINRFPGKVHGHIQIWNGNNWISDANQKSASPYNSYASYHNAGGFDGLTTIYRDTGSTSVPTQDFVNTKMQDMKKSFKDAMNGKGGQDTSVSGTIKNWVQKSLGGPSNPTMSQRYANIGIKSSKSSKNTNNTNNSNNANNTNASKTSNVNNVNLKNSGEINVVDKQSSDIPNKSEVNEINNYSKNEINNVVTKNSSNITQVQTDNSTSVNNINNINVKKNITKQENFKYLNTFLLN